MANLTDSLAFFEYAPSLFTSSGELAVKSRNRFPRDQRFFDLVRGSQAVLNSFQSSVLPVLVSKGPLLRERPPLSFAHLALNDIYIPVLSVMTSALSTFSTTVSSAYATQDERFEQLDNKLRLIVQSVDSLTYWALQYRSSALDLLRLNDEERVKVFADEEEDRRFRLRSEMLAREYERLWRQLQRSGRNYERAKREYLEKFQAEISQRDFVVSVLTQYLTNALFLPLGEGQTVSKKNIPPLEGRPVRDYLDVLIPLYVSFRNAVEEYNLEKALIDYLEEYSREEMRKTDRNVLVTKYLRDASTRTAT